MERPLIAVTMGDPSGVGPEVIAKALAMPEIQGICRPLVLGDPAAMERAFSVTGSRLSLQIVDDSAVPSAFSADTINLLPLFIFPDDINSAALVSAGDAMFRYIRAARLASGSRAMGDRLA
jgi:4-hydroxythreonine-4-phosphate dehydrogenase